MIRTLKDYVERVVADERVADSSVATEAAARRLLRAGYKADVVGEDQIRVLDPVQCSSGRFRWTEYESRVIREHQVDSFLFARS